MSLDASSPVANDADGSSSPLSLNSPINVRVEAANAPKTPLLNVHEEAEHLYPAVIDRRRHRQLQQLGLSDPSQKAENHGE